MKLFKSNEKPELTEEQKKELEEKKAKRKTILVNGVKVVVGIVAFCVGGLLVAAAMGVATEEESASAYLPEPEEPAMLPRPDEVAEEEPEPIVVDSEVA